MQGLEGTLIRKKSSLRFVLTLELINQSAALDVTADELEPTAVARNRLSRRTGTPPQIDVQRQSPRQGPVTVYRRKQCQNFFFDSRK